MSPQRVDLAEATALLTRLTALLRKESAMLAGLQVEPLRELIRQKEPLAEAYEALAAALRRDPTPLREASREARAGFADAIRAFETEAARNRRQLQGARAVVERILRVVARTMEQGDGRAATYRPASCVAVPAGGARAMALNYKA